MKWSLALLAVLIMSCSESKSRDGTSKDATIDAGHAVDAEVDSGVDAKMEDSGTPDSSIPDSGSIDSAVPDMGQSGPFDHCPSAAEYVGSSSWAGLLRAGSETAFCVFPKMYDTPQDALTKKKRLKIVAGDYPLPLSSTGDALRIPACLERRNGTPPTILEGTVTAERRQGFDDPTERYYIEGQFPLSDSSGYVMLGIRTDLTQTTIDLRGPISNYRDAQLSRCVDASCTDASDLFLLPCRLESNTCDTFDFVGGSVNIDQFHWSGAVGSGFAAGVRIRGQLDGTSFDIDSYDQMVITYGHHAFNRAMMVFFDAPISGVCGLEIEEITESSGATSTHLLDCLGVRIGDRTITGQSHLWQQPCP